jgi:hypothetical protein
MAIFSPPAGDFLRAKSVISTGLSATQFRLLCEYKEAFDIGFWS